MKFKTSESLYIKIRWSLLSCYGHIELFIITIFIKIIDGETRTNVKKTIPSGDKGKKKQINSCDKTGTEVYRFSNVTFTCSRYQIK